MPYIDFNSIAQPSNPASGYVRLYYDNTSNELQAIDSAGNVCRLGGLLHTDYRLIKVTDIFQGTTSYSPTASAKALYVECIGAGASGGGGASTASDAAVGSGGGGGAYSAIFLTGASVKGTFTVQVGQGGSAPSTGNNPGNAGTDTTFDSPSVCTAKGGAAGSGQAAGTAATLLAGGAGGASGSGVGDITLAGNAGGFSYRVSGTLGFAGQGAPGPWGGAPTAAIAQGNGNPGGNYGAGGTGGCTLNGGAATAGGAGANGLIRVWEFA